MKIYSLLFVVAMSSCAQSSSNVDKQAETVTNISQEEFKSKFEDQEGLQLLDVRTPGEIAHGKIGNARELDIFDSEFNTKIAALGFDKTKTVVIYCRSGGRSAKASQVFLDQGYTKVYNLLGGYSSYK